MRWRSASVTAFSCTLLLAGCGGGNVDQTKPRPRPPRIPADVAQRLAAEADVVARLTPGSCTARAAAIRFRRDVIASVGHIPSRYQEPLLSAANNLAESLAACSEPRREKKGHEKHGKKRGHKKHEDEQ